MRKERAGNSLGHQGEPAEDGRDHVSNRPPNNGVLLASWTRCGAETHRLESIYRQKLAALDELKKSLLHQAFSGQL